MNDDVVLFLVCVFALLVIGFFGGIIAASPTMKDVVTLDNRRCILIYEQDVVHKFCEAK
jgi:hypothetical protein